MIIKLHIRSSPNNLTKHRVDQSVAKSDAQFENEESCVIPLRGLYHRFGRSDCARYTIDKAFGQWTRQDSRTWLQQLGNLARPITDILRLANDSQEQRRLCTRICRLGTQRCQAPRINRIERRWLPVSQYR
jgi:hypothetical protein